MKEKMKSFKLKNSEKEVEFEENESKINDDKIVTIDTKKKLIDTIIIKLIDKNLIDDKKSAIDQNINNNNIIYQILFENNLSGKLTIPEDCKIINNFSIDKDVLLNNKIQFQTLFNKEMFNYNNFTSENDKNNLISYVEFYSVYQKLMDLHESDYNSLFISNAKTSDHTYNCKQEIDPIQSHYFDSLSTVFECKELDNCSSNIDKIIFNYQSSLNKFIFKIIKNTFNELIKHNNSLFFKLEQTTHIYNAILKKIKSKKNFELDFEEQEKVINMNKKNKFKNNENKNISQKQNHYSDEKNKNKKKSSLKSNKIINKNVTFSDEKKPYKSLNANKRKKENFKSENLVRNILPDLSANKSSFTNLNPITKVKSVNRQFVKSNSYVSNNKKERNVKKSKATKNKRKRSNNQTINNDENGNEGNSENKKSKLKNNNNSNDNSYVKSKNKSSSSFTLNVEDIFGK
jgi:hypothetical protein